MRPVDPFTTYPELPVSAISHIQTSENHPKPLLKVVLGCESVCSSKFKSSRNVHGAYDDHALRFLTRFPTENKKGGFGSDMNDLQEEWITGNMCEIIKIRL